MSNIKKLAALLLVSIIVFSFSSCDTNFLNKILPGNYDASFGKRPDYFPNTKWVSEEPNIWFEVIEEVNDIANFEENALLQIRDKGENDITVTLFCYDNKIEMKRETDEYLINFFFEKGISNYATYLLKD